jgi:Sec-independent protein translocase protein TatA
MSIIHLLRMVGWGLAGGLLCGSIVAAVARFAPLLHDRLWSVGLVVAGVVAAAGWSIFRKISLLDAARKMDADGLEERMRTALQYADDRSAVARMQREDALLSGEQYIRELAKRLPLGVERRPLAIVGVLALLLLIQLAWPNPMREKASALQEEKSWLQQIETTAKEQAETWDKSKSASPLAAGMEEALERLAQELHRTASAEDGLDRIEEALERMNEQLEQEMQRGQSFEKKLDDAGNVPELKQLRDLLESGRPEGIGEAIKELQRTANQADDAGQKRIAAGLDQLAAADLGRDAQESLRQAADELRGEDGALRDAALQRLQSGLEAAAQARADALRSLAAAQQAAGSLAQAALPMAEQLAAQGAAPSGAWAAGGLAQSLAAAGSGGGSSGAGAGSSGSAGAGAGSSSSDGAGAGSGGAGAGSSGGGAGAGSGGSAGGVGNGSRSLVTTPRDVVGSGNEQGDTGPVTGGNGEVQQTGLAQAAEGTLRSYEDVYGEYADEANRSLGRNELPQSVQNLVKDYFLDIQPNR